jgi:hypothetical protein
MTDRKPAVIGCVDVIGRDQVTGWAADTAKPTSNVEVVVSSNGVPIARGVARLERPDLRKVFEGSSGCYGFEFAFDPPLSAWRSHSLSVTAAGIPLPKGSALLEAVSNRQDGVQPIIVTTTGRSGSSLLMSCLSRHRNIVVGGPHPFEVKLLIYYSLALILHISDADRARSLDPNTMGISLNRYSIGRNPFNHPTMIPHHALEVYWKRRLPAILRGAFAEAILEYYEAQRVHLGRVNHRYFAEKMHPNPELRGATRYLFPETREILLVRDPRDMLCSYHRFWGASLPDAIRNISDQLRHMLQIKSEQTAHIVRYEDLVLNEEAAVGAVCTFLQLPNVLLPREEGADSVFRSHATSESAASSIGRWKTELDAQTRSAIAQWQGFLKEFGYSES